jgi:uncharacterized protein YggE
MRILLVALVATLVGLPGVTSAAEPPRTISVSGHAEVQATPDRARVNAGVVSQAARASEAVDQNASAMRGVFAALQAAGVAEADIGTSGFNVSPVFEQVERSRQAPRIVAYRVTNTVTALVRDTATVGATLDALIKGGANTLNGVSFFVAPDEATQDRLRVAAVKDAARKAAMMAEAAGAQLGDVITISETGRGGGPSPARFRSEALASVPVAAGTSTLSMDVAVTFALR